MHKETITYTDFDGNEKTKTFYFNLTKAELLEMEADADGGFADKIKRIVDSGDSSAIMKTFKEFILKSYGVLRTDEDGEYFDKSEELSHKFERTAAYDALFMELCTNADVAAKFINNIMPLTKEEREEVMKKQAELTKLPESID